MQNFIRASGGGIALQAPAADADAQRHLSRIAALDYVAYIEPDFRTRALRVPGRCFPSSCWGGGVRYDFDRDTNFC